jgi:hypothetical protein
MNVCIFIFSTHNGGRSAVVRTEFLLLPKWQKFPCFLFFLRLCVLLCVCNVSTFARAYFITVFSATE